MDLFEEKKLEVIRFIDSLSGNFRKFPVTLHISLTDKCLNKCITCEHWKRKDFYYYDFKELIKILDYGRNNGLHSVVYTGGDPFLYKNKDINELLFYHVEHNIPFGFVTSGYIPKYVNIEMLKKCEFISVSLDESPNKASRIIKTSPNPSITIISKN